MDTKEFAPGAVLGEYLLQKRLNEGVPHAWYALAGPERIPVVLKVLPSWARSHEADRRFLAERSTLRRLLSAPHVVRITGFGERAGHMWIEMPHAGENVADLLRRKGPFPEPVASAFTYAVLLALDATHCLTYPSQLPVGIVHRDVNTSNILVARSGEIALCDFGAVYVRAQDPLTIPQQLLGTPGCRPPEYVTGSHYTHQGDLWAAGVALREMLTGRQLFDPNARGKLEHTVPPASSDGRQVSAALERFLAWMTAKRPCDRPATARAALAELCRLGRMAADVEIAQHFYGEEEARDSSGLLRPWTEPRGPVWRDPNPTMIGHAATIHADLRRHVISFHGRPLKLSPQLFYALAYLALHPMRCVSMKELDRGMAELGHRRDKDGDPIARVLGSKLRDALYAVAKDLYSSRPSMRLVLENVGGDLRLNIPGTVEPPLAQRA